MVDAVAERGAATPPPEPGLLVASGPGRRLILVSEVRAAMAATHPGSRDKLVVPVLRTALGDRLGSSA